MTFPFLILLISFSLTYFTIPRAIQKFSERDLVVVDMYKADKPKIPTNAGLVIIFTSYLTISLIPLLIRFLNLTPFADFDWLSCTKFGDSPVASSNCFWLKLS